MKRILLIVAFLLLFAINSYADNYTLEFDGSGDWVMVPDSDDWYFGKGDFTIECWVKFHLIKPYIYLVGQWQGSWDNSWGCWMENEKLVMRFSKVNNKIRGYYIITVKWNKINGDYIKTDAWKPSKDIWYHFAFVRSGAKGLVFIDGILQAAIEEVPFSNNDVGNISAPLEIGALNGEVVAEYNGCLDEIRIWHCARTEQELNDWMYYSLTGKEPNLVAYWNFDEGSGKTVYDLTSNNHDGQIIGDPEFILSDGPYGKPPTLKK